MKQEIINEINAKIFGFLSDNEVLTQDGDLQEMLFYALGFNKDGGLLSGGKRLRPLFSCLVCGAVSGDHHQALLYGASLEMLHNFTLVHDDIEDNGGVRHNRPALWKRDGLAIALNAGDMLYQTALSAAAQADRETGLNGLERVMKMSADLFLGQHRDISFENRTDINEAEYIRMVRGKTSALLGCSFALGAMAGGASEEIIRDYQHIGQEIGVAFQIRDDYLGTWGNKEVFGKSVSGDIMEKKNTLAVIYTQSRDPEFRRKWTAYDGCAERVPEFAAMMEKAGAPEYLAEQCETYTRAADAILERYPAVNEYGRELDQLINALVNRKK